MARNSANQVTLRFLLKRRLPEGDSDVDLTPGSDTSWIQGVSKSIHPLVTGLQMMKKHPADSFFRPAGK
jgi:hypothetical protein